MSDRNELALLINDPEKLREALGSFNTEALILLRWKMLWRAQARRKQVVPDHDWKIFGVRSGRGFGKTLAGAQWAGQRAASMPGSYHFVVAPTYDDVRYTCCPADTRIFTRRGQTRIVDVVVDDEVMTRVGWRKVTASGLTGTRPVLRLEAEEFTLETTYDHPVWVENKRRFLPASELKLGDQVLVLKSSNSTAVDSDVTPTPRNEAIKSIFVDGIRGNGSLCIEPFGFIIEEKSPKIISSITEKIMSIIESGISSVLRHPLITLFTIGKSQRDISETSTNSPECDSSPNSGVGIEPRRVENTLVGMLRLCWKRLSDQRVSVASSAGKNLPPSELVELSTARRAVVTKVSAVDGRVPVYNISVEGQPEFFANGILIHNCFQGPTGLFEVIPPQLIADCNLTLPSITLTNRAIIRGFAGDAPERLRGPQCHGAWLDEIASWRYPEKAWDNLIMGLRLGDLPQIFWTGTPKPKPFVNKLCKMTDVLVLGSTYENSENLTDVFYENVAKYEGTVIGRQELHGELIDPEEAGFVKRSDWRLWPAKKPLPKFKFIVLSLDTAFTEKTFDKKDQQTDPTAASVWGLFEWERKDHVMLLDCWEDHLGFPALVKKVKSERDLTYGDTDEPLIRPIIRGPNAPRHQGRKPDTILIEDKGSGISLRQSLSLENIVTEPYNPGHMDKLSRLHAISPLFPAKRVWAVESSVSPGQPRSWADPLITQVCSYVGEGSLEHDDLLDTTTQALKLLMDKFRMTFTNRIDPDAKTKEALDRLKKKARTNPYG